jgi:hypothetical protein
MRILTILKSGWGPWLICWRLMPSWHKLIMEGINFDRLTAWVLSPDWLSRKTDFCQALRWRRRACGGTFGPYPDFASYTLVFPLQLRKIRKTSFRVTEKRSADQRRTRFVLSTWPSQAMASTGLLALTALGSRFRRRGQPSVSISICLVAVIWAFPLQLTLSQSSQSGLWCGRETAGHSDPSVSACYVRTRGSSSKAKTLGLQHL